MAGLFGDYSYNKMSRFDEGQQNLFNKLTGSANQGFNTYNQNLQNMAYTPQSSYNAVDSALNFQNGVVTPALQQMNTQLANARHTNKLHSSAAANQQRLIQQDTMNNINAQRYQQMLQQQQLQQQAQESALARQGQYMAALGSQYLSPLSMQTFDMQQQYNPGFLDGLGAVTGAIGNLGKGIGGIVSGITGLGSLGGGGSKSRN